MQLLVFALSLAKPPPTLLVSVVPPREPGRPTSLVWIALPRGAEAYATARVEPAARGLAWEVDGARFLVKVDGDARPGEYLCKRTRPDGTPADLRLALVGY